MPERPHSCIGFGVCALKHGALGERLAFDGFETKYLSSLEATRLRLLTNDLYHRFLIVHDDAGTILAQEPAVVGVKCYAFSGKNRCPPELPQWIFSTVIVGVMLNLFRITGQDIK